LLEIQETFPVEQEPLAENEEMLPHQEERFVENEETIPPKKGRFPVPILSSIFYQATQFVQIFASPRIPAISNGKFSSILNFIPLS